MITKIYQKIASWTPRRLLYFMVIQAWAYATTEKFSDRTPDQVTWGMVCDYLTKDKCPDCGHRHGNER